MLSSEYKQTSLKSSLHGDNILANIRQSNSVERVNNNNTDKVEHAGDVNLLGGFNVSNMLNYRVVKDPIDH